jgi:hypothetical protein
VRRGDGSRRCSGVRTVAVPCSSWGPISWRRGRERGRSSAAARVSVMAPAAASVWPPCAALASEAPVDVAPRSTSAAPGILVGKGTPSARAALGAGPAGGSSRNRASPSALGILDSWPVQEPSCAGGGSRRGAGFFERRRA